MGKNFSVSYEERIGAIEKYLRHEDSLKLKYCIEQQNNYAETAPI
ncbi:MAG: hypothetical protein H6Q72_3759 [Firmicutes bacterium]|nr:hypothetical protein [Bacillota bacterium]